MKRKPIIGEHVVFAGNAAIGPCAGKVEKIYPAYDPNDPFREVPFDPVRSAVSVRVDAVPDKWPYCDKIFAPRAVEIEPTAARMPGDAA